MESCHLIIICHLEFQARAFRPHDEDDDDSDDDFSDDEELQSPIDEVDPFVFFVDTIKGTANFEIWYVFELNFILVLLDLPATAPWITAMQASDPLRFQNLTQTLEFQYQALANGVAQHADQRRVEIEKEKMEKASAAATQWLKNSMDMAVKKFWFAFWVYCLFYPFSDDLEKSIAGRVQSIFVGSMVRESLSVARDFPVCKCLELCVSKIPLVRHNTGTAACWGCSWGW